MQQLQQQESQDQQQLTQAHLQEQQTLAAINQAQEQEQSATQALGQAQRQFQSAQQLLAKASASSAPLHSQLSQAQSDLSQAQSRAADMHNAEQSLQQLISQNHAQIAATQASANRMTTLYAQTKSQEVVTEHKKQVMMGLLNSQLQFIEQHGSIGYLSVLVGVHSFSQLVGRVQMLGQIVGQTGDLGERLTLQVSQLQFEQEHLAGELSLIQKAQAALTVHQALLGQEEATLTQAVAVSAQQVQQSQGQISRASQQLQQNAQLAQQAQAQTQQTQQTMSHASQSLATTQNSLAQLQHQQAQITNNIAQLGSQIQQIAQQIQAAITQFNQGTLTQNGLYQSLYPLVAPVAGQDGLSPDLVLGVITEESGGNATIVSPAGAVGLMQLEPGTAQYLGINPAELSDPQVNLVAGCLYLKDMLALFGGNTSLALSAYNAGPGAVEANNNQVLSYTQGYVNNIEALMAQYEQM